MSEIHDIPLGGYLEEAQLPKYASAREEAAEDQKKTLRPAIIKIPAKVSTTIRVALVINTHPVQMLINCLDTNGAKLAELPTEILTMILMEVTIFDRACVALTCKILASLITSGPKFITMPGMLANNHEEESLEHAVSRYAHLAKSSDEYDNVQYLAVQYAYRIDPSYLVEFKLRLSFLGPLKYCEDCDRWVSTVPEFWKKRNDHFMYHDNSLVARSWRSGKCSCEEHAPIWGPEDDAKGYIRRWIREQDCSVCPVCEVRRWSYQDSCEGLRKRLCVEREIGDDLDQAVFGKGCWL